MEQKAVRALLPEPSPLRPVPAGQRAHLRDGVGNWLSLVKEEDAGSLS